MTEQSAQNVGEVPHFGRNVSDFTELHFVPSCISVVYFHTHTEEEKERHKQRDGEMHAHTCTRTDSQP